MMLHGKTCMKLVLAHQSYHRSRYFCIRITRSNDDHAAPAKVPGGKHVPKMMGGHPWWRAPQAKFLAPPTTTATKYVTFVQISKCCVHSPLWHHACPMCCRVQPIELASAGSAPCWINNHTPEGHRWDKGAACPAWLIQTRAPNRGYVEREREGQIEGETESYCFYWIPQHRTKKSRRVILRAAPKQPRVYDDMVLLGTKIKLAKSICNICSNGLLQYLSLGASYRPSTLLAKV